MELVYYFFIVDAVLMFLVMIIANRSYGIPVWKIVLLAILLLPVGVVGSKLMRLIEAGRWDGYSYFGCVFFVPIMMTPIALLLKCKPIHVLDLCAPAGCVVLATMKVQCVIQGCCRGRITGFRPDGMAIRFPSQKVELVNGLIILIVLLITIRKGKQKGYIYAWFMLIYGITRFCLNLLRETTPFILGLSAGCFWSIIAVAIGGTVFLLRSREGKKGNA